MLITHFTPWDHNWPYGPPPGAKPPKLKEFEWKDPNDPCQQQGSAIGCETQTLGESIPVTGTGMTLDYTTERTPGWRVRRDAPDPDHGRHAAAAAEGHPLTIDVAGEKIEKRWCDPSYPTTGATTCKDYPLITPNLDYAFRWDGLDAYDRAIQGRVTAKIQVIYVYEFKYYDAPRTFDSSFGQFGSDTRGLRRPLRVRQPVAATMDTHFFCGIPIGQTITRAIGSWDARPTDGLGGWSLTEHHAYDPVERALRRGDGSTVRAEALPPVVETLAGNDRSGVGGGRGSGNYPKDGDAANEANIDYLGRLRPLARRQPVPAQRPQPQRHLPRQPRRQDLPVRRQRHQGRGAHRRRWPGQERRPRLRPAARRGARRRADHRLLRRRLRHGDLPPRLPGRLEDRDHRGHAATAAPRWATASRRARRTSASSTT